MIAQSDIKIDTYVFDTLMRDLVGHDHQPSAFLIYIALTAISQQTRPALSHAALAELTGLSRRSVQNALKTLQQRQLLDVKRIERTDIAEYSIRTPWRVFRSGMTTPYAGG